MKTDIQSIFNITNKYHQNSFIRNRHNKQVELCNVILSTFLISKWNIDM